MVYYDIDASFSEVMINFIENGAWTWTHNSPVRFMRSSDANDRILVTPTSDGNCLSMIGHIGGVQTLFLNDGACSFGRVIHELGHALGLGHENIRPDSSSYVTLHPENVVAGYMLNFMWIPGLFAYGDFDYDFGSIMHYATMTFSKGSAPTLQPIKPQLQQYTNKYPNDLPRGQIGQRNFLSTLDKKMTYSYMSECASTQVLKNPVFYQGDWVTAPFGGCAVLCDGASYRQRLVSCQLGGSPTGACLPESSCSQPKPPVFTPCELTSGALSVTFDEENWGNVGGMMENVAYYDQFDWLVWRDYPPKISADGQLSDGIISLGPGVDASQNGTGRYLLFMSVYPARSGDQAWYESPVVGTNNSDSCWIQFSWFLTDKTGSLQLQAVSCLLCNSKRVLWKAPRVSNAWAQQSVTIPSGKEKVKLRFIATAGQQANGFIGLDSIVFSEGCIRSNLQNIVANLPINGSLSYPYPDQDPNCVYINPNHPGFVWTVQIILAVTFGGAVCCCCTLLTGEYFIRRRKYKKILKSLTASRKEIKKAASRLNSMTPGNVVTMAHQTTMIRTQTATAILPVVASSVQRLSAISGVKKDDLTPFPRFHRNKSFARKRPAAGAREVELVFRPSDIWDELNVSSFGILKTIASFWRTTEARRISVEPTKPEHSNANCHTLSRTQRQRTVSLDESQGMAMENWLEGDLSMNQEDVPTTFRTSSIMRRASYNNTQQRLRANSSKIPETEDEQCSKKAQYKGPETEDEECAKK